MNPLTSVKGSIVTAFVLAAIVSIWLTIAAGTQIEFHHAQLARWLHIVSGVMWIGLLYYFNVVQVPGLADAAADKGGPGGAGITKYVAPRALLWFRWAAVVTWITGAWYLGSGFGDSNAFVRAFTLQPGFRTLASACGSARSCCSTSGSSSGRTRRRSSVSFRRPTSRKPPRARPRSTPRGSNFILSFPC